MPSNSIKELNRTCFATRIPAEGATYAAIQLDKRSQPIAISDITWGFQIIDPADRVLFSGSYIAIIRNMDVDANTTLSSVAPVGLPAGAELLWVDFQNNLGGQTHKQFSTPFVLQPGDKYVIIMPSPNFTAGITTTVYFQISINAQLLLTENPGQWRLR